MTPEPPDTLKYSFELDRERVTLPTRFAGRAFFTHIVLANALTYVCMLGIAAFTTATHTPSIDEAIGVIGMGLLFGAGSGACLGTISDAVLMRLLLRSYYVKNARSSRSDLLIKLGAYVLLEFVLMVATYDLLADRVAFPSLLTALLLGLQLVITHLLALLACRKAGRLSIDATSIRWASSMGLLRLRHRKRWSLNGELNIGNGSDMHGLNINETSLLGSEGLWDRERVWLVTWLKTHATFKEVELGVASSRPEVTEAPEALEALRRGKNVSTE
jgi:hypothetical protein